MPAELHSPPLPDDNLPPHLASPEAFARWCRENPEGVRQMEGTFRCSAAVLGGGFPHRPGAGLSAPTNTYWRRDACATGQHLPRS